MLESALKKIKNMNEEKIIASESKGLSFRAQLVLYGITLVLIVGLPVLVIESKRPWNALDAMILHGHGVLAGIETGFETREVKIMNEFALRIAGVADPEDEDYLVWTFNMIILEDRLLTEEEMKSGFEENEKEVEKFDYTRVKAGYEFWQKELAVPGLTEIFRKYKRRILAAKEQSNDAKINLEDIYLMVDDGKTFAFILDGFPWTDSTYPGMKYDVVENGDAYWRCYLQQGPGFYFNPKHYYLHLFPKFDTDQWGTWYTIWFAKKNENIYNAFSIDFEASSVKKEMWMIGEITIGATLFLLIIVIAVSRKLTNLITIPIKYLVEGTEAIIKQDYDYVAPEVKSREFKKPIEVLNKMIKQHKELVELQASFRALKEVDELKDNFLSMVSHDLRTPMTSIKGYASVMAEKVDTFDKERMKKYLNIIITEADRLTRLIGNLLELQRFDAGRMTLEMADIDIVRLIDISLDSFKGATMAKHQTLESKLPEGPVMINGNEDRLMQVFANILSNSIKFTPENGRIFIAMDFIDEGGSKFAKFSVTDNGPGIPIEMQEKLFNKFHQVKTLVRSKEQGSGLGLSLVKEIVAYHGGKVGVVSEEGKGSTFFFTLKVI